MKVMLRAQLSRLRLLGTHPLVALRQEITVLLAVAAVGLGFLEGALRPRGPVARIPGAEAQRRKVS